MRRHVGASGVLNAPNASVANKGRGEMMVPPSNKVLTRQGPESLASVLFVKARNPLIVHRTTPASSDQVLGQNSDQARMVDLLDLIQLET